MEELYRKIEALEQEKEQQAQEIVRLRRKIAELEEENDLLALENDRLRNSGGEATKKKEEEEEEEEETATLWDTPMAKLATGGGGVGAGGGAADDRVGIFKLPPDLSYLDEGDGRFVSKEAHTIEGVGGGLNPLCVRVARLRGDDAAAGSSPSPLLLATGGVDKFLTLYLLDNSDDGSAVPQKAAVVGGFPGPLLSLDLAPSVIVVEETREDEDAGETITTRWTVRPALVTCMDGSHAIVHLDVDRLEDSAIAHQHKAHTKHAVIGRFSPCGSLYATGSHDKSVRVYDAASREELKALYFTGNVEAMCFVEVKEEADEAAKTPYLVVASRGVAHLTYLNCRTWEKRQVSLNQAEWDDHVSFSVLALAPSPCQQYLLAATDKSRLIVYRVGSNQQLRNLYGHRADEYSNPRAVWDRSGKYVFCSSQDGNELVGWSVASERVVATLKGHQGIVRDVDYDPRADRLASVAYDKTLRVWRS